VNSSYCRLSRAEFRRRIGRCKKQLFAINEVLDDMERDEEDDDDKKNN
jgi:hypothetical protein